MTDVPLKADTPKACSLKFGAEFFWFRLVPAALINSVLITGCMIVVCCFAIIIDVNVRAGAGPKLVSVLFQLGWMCTAALAPLWYAMIWRWLGFRQSPGEEWLHLSLSQGVGLPGSAALIDLGLAIAPYILSALLPVAMLFGFAAQPASINPGDVLIAATLAMLSAYFISTAAVQLLQMFRRLRREADLDQAGTGCLETGALRNPKRLILTLQVLLIPLFLISAAFTLSPSYFTASLHCPLIIAAMSVLVLWLIISALIVRFWDSPYSTLVYFLCFILPICGVIVSLPALRTCVH